MMGNIDSMDWKDYGAKTILRTVMEDKELQGGSIIRLNSEAKYTKEALPKLIESLEREGFRLVTLSQLLYQEAYHLDVKGRQIQMTGDQPSFLRGFGLWTVRIFVI